ncbi:MAG TPA: cytochrome c oxidase subunit 3, partial [Rhodopila sp.]|nr:cytochrome c oxidase subunit 3 [Rhodopila sp.]
ASLPWLEVGTRAEFPHTQASLLPSAKIGLGVFLAVATCLFALLSSAYLMRTDSAVPDLATGARLLPPSLLWVNTAVLAASSIALQWASVSARRGQRELLLGNLAAGGVAATGFVAGQLLAWRLLAEGGHPLGSGPANDFFYLLTAAHALHVVGGLAVLSVTFVKALGETEPARLRLTIELCAYYWHFLLLVWVALFGLLMGGVDALGSLCRALVT